MAPPRDAQPDHGPACGACCQMCQSALSRPRANTSSRPSVLSAATGSLVMPPPSEDHADHGPECGTICQMCQSALSVPRTNTSSCPSELSIAAGSLGRTPPRGDPGDPGPPCGAPRPVWPRGPFGPAAQDLT